MDPIVASYKASIRALLRYSIAKLNQGDYSLMLKLASPDFELAFPGDNSWSTMFRPQQRGRHRHSTHRGIDEAVAFADRFVDEGLQMVVEDVVVNGPPWNVRIARGVPEGASHGHPSAAMAPASAVPLAVMAIDPDSLLRKALALPADRRAEFAADLLASLDRDQHDDPVEVRAAWAAELERRARRAVSGEDPGRPWPGVRDRVRSKLSR
jgi:putative addiction module component (TIGR02574 family)